MDSPFNSHQDNLRLASSAGFRGSLAKTRTLRRSHVDSLLINKTGLLVERAHARACASKLWGMRQQ